MVPTCNQVSPPTRFHNSAYPRVARRFRWKSWRSSPSILGWLGDGSRRRCTLPALVVMQYWLTSAAGGRRTAPQGRANRRDSLIRLFLHRGRSTSIEGRARSSRQIVRKIGLSSSAPSDPRRSSGHARSRCALVPKIPVTVPRIPRSCQSDILLFCGCGFQRSHGQKDATHRSQWVAKALSTVDQLRRSSDLVQYITMSTRQ